MEAFVITTTFSSTSSSCTSSSPSSAYYESFSFSGAAPQGTMTYRTATYGETLRFLSFSLRPPPTP